MTLVAGAGPRADSIQFETSANPPGDRAGHGSMGTWSNVRPLQREGSAAVGQFLDLLAAISHEMRTPLNAVIGFSDAMEQELFGPIGNARYREYVGHIRSSGVEVLKAAEDALMMTAVLAQPKARALHDIPLAALVAEAAGDHAGPVEIDIADDIQVRADRRILPRAVQQLISIACARCAAAGGVRVSATAVHGLVELMVEVEATIPGAPELVVPEAAEIAGMALGRRELAVWLATGLLDLMDCRLDIETRGGSLRMRTTLEQSCQGFFFSDEGLRRV